MSRFVLGLLIGAGLAFTILAIIESEERKRQAIYERMKERSKRP